MTRTVSRPWGWWGSVLAIAALGCVPLLACSRESPTAARWKVHIAPASGESSELSITIAAPDLGHAFSRRAIDEGFAIEVRKWDRVAFAAVVSEQPGGTAYRFTMHNASGVPVAVTASPVLVLVRDDRRLEGNRVNLPGEMREVSLHVERREQP